MHPLSKELDKLHVEPMFRELPWETLPQGTTCPMNLRFYLYWDI